MTLAAIRDEHLATRNGVGIFDFTMLCKFEVSGPGALALVNQISTNEMDVQIGKVVYTAWCGDDGRFLADGTIARMALDHFRLVGTDIAMESIRELLHHGQAEVLTRDPLATVEIRDRTESLSIINIQGPASRRLLENLTSSDLSQQTFPLNVAPVLQGGRGCRRWVAGKFRWRIGVGTFRRQLRRHFTSTTRAFRLEPNSELSRVESKRSTRWLQRRAFFILATRSTNQ